MADLMRSYLNVPLKPPPILPHLRPPEMGPTVGVIKPSCLSHNSHFTWRGESYIRCCALAQKPRSRRARLSVIWFYGEDVVKEEDSEGQALWYCYLCEQQLVEMKQLYVVGDGNDSPLNHLERSHQINRFTGARLASSIPPSDVGSSEGSLPSAFGRQKHLLAAQFKVFQDLLIRWIVYCHVAFF